jgi:hypothetical protein
VLSSGEITQNTQVLKELTKLRKDSEIQAPKAEILSFGRRMDEISSGGVKVFHDHRIWRRNTGVNP